MAGTTENFVGINYPLKDYIWLKFQKIIFIYFLEKKKKNYKKVAFLLIFLKFHYFQLQLKHKYLFNQIFYT